MTRSKLDGNSIVCAEKLGVIRLVARWDHIAPRAPFKQPPSHQELESTRLCDCTPIVLPFSNSRPRDKVIRYVFWLLFLESCFKILLFISFDDPDWENCSINNSNAKHRRPNKSFLQTTGCQVVSVTEMQIPRDMYLSISQRIWIWFHPKNQERRSFKRDEFKSTSCKGENSCRRAIIGELEKEIASY